MKEEVKVEGIQEIFAGDVGYHSNSDHSDSHESADDEFDDKPSAAKPFKFKKVEAPSL